MFKLALYGDSLANPRHSIVKSNERYLSIIENFIRNQGIIDFIEIRDNAKGGATLYELFEKYKEDNTYFELPGNLLIIHAGIVDCAPRPVTDNTRTRISKLPKFLKKIVIKYIHHNRVSLIKKNNGYVKTSLTLFKEQLFEFVNHGKDNYEKIFIINICPTNVTIEQRSPGFTNNINKYNKAINEVISEIGSNRLRLINLNQYINQNIIQIDDYVVKEDGHHIHSLTHTWIAKEIIKQIN